MSHVVIVGAGFAGVWSAIAAARVRGESDLRITVVAPNDEMVLRPRMYEPEPELATVPLKELLEPVGVAHHRAGVTSIDVDTRQVTADDGRQLRYDRLVLASGSRLVRPSIPGAGALFSVDTLPDAMELRAHLRDRADFTALVVGAGFVGLEIATELAGRGRVILVDRNEAVGPELGPGPRPAIEAALDELGIERCLSTTVAHVHAYGADLADGTKIEADAVIWAAGMEASPLTEQIPGVRDRLGRLAVDRYLRAYHDVYAAGDVAAAAFDAGHTVMQSFQHAVPLGKVAGHNAAADLLGLTLRDFLPGPYITDLSLGPAGAVLTRGWEREVESTGADGQKVKNFLMNVIRPPVESPGLMSMNSDRIYEIIPPADEL